MFRIFISLGFASYCLMDGVDCTEFKMVPISKDFQLCPNAKNDILDVSGVKMVVKDDDGIIFINGSLEIKKKISSPVLIDATISTKKLGIWSPIWIGGSKDACEEIGKEGKPWSEFVEQLMQSRKSCPMEPGTINLDMVPWRAVQSFEGDMSGVYKLQVTDYGVVDGKRQRLLCFTLDFESEEM